MNIKSIADLKNRISYGWAVVFGFLIIGTVIFGLRFTFGVFFKSLESEFELSRAATSSIFSVYMALGAFFTIIGGWVLDKYGPRLMVLLMSVFITLSLGLTSQTTAVWQLYFTYSLLLALGSSAMFTTVMSTVARWFDKNRGVAMGIGGCGAGLGILFMAPLATYLISTFDWRTAYLIMGLGAMVVLVPASRLMKARPYTRQSAVSSPQNGAEEDKDQRNDLTLRQSLRKKSLWLFLTIYFLVSSCQLLVMTHLVPHITDIGFSAAEAATIFGLVGVGGIIGRVTVGILSDKIGRSRTVILTCFLQSTITLGLLWVDQLWMFAVFAIMFGLSYQGRGPVMSALIGDTFGLKHMGKILGFIECGFNLGAAFGPALGGLIYDATRSYTLAFVFAASTVLAVALLISMVRRETTVKEERPALATQN